MPIIIDNDGIRFCEEFRKLCQKYVRESSILQMTFNDGTKIGMRTLLEIGLGIKRIEDCI